jgi:hypothetical protein
MYLALKSGRKLSVQQFLVRRSVLGVLEGSSAMIRRHVLAGAKKEAERIFGAAFGFLLSEPAEGPLPEYQIYVELLSFTPIKKGADCSSLVCSWFESAIPEKPADYIAEKIQSIDWDAHAKDGHY